MIVVTAPTGNIGHHVVADLIAADTPFRIIVRDARKLSAEARHHAEVIEGSHGDADVIEHALAGANALFWIAPPDSQKTLEEVYLDFTRPAVEAIARHGVERVVSITALGRGTAWERKAGLVSASIAMDNLLKQSGAAFRGLALPSFMDNVVQQAAAIRDHGIFFGPIDPDKALPTTATRDIGAVAARLLADKRWSGQKEVAVLGPDDLSFNDMAAIMADVLGREVRYQQIPFDAFKAQVLSGGVSASFAQGYVDMMQAKNEGMDNVAEVLANERTTTSFRQFCEKIFKTIRA